MTHKRICIGELNGSKCSEECPHGKPHDYIEYFSGMEKHGGCLRLESNGKSVSPTGNCKCVILTKKRMLEYLTNKL
jgi:hypothetical protein